MFSASEHPFHLTKYLSLTFAYCDREPSLYKRLFYSLQFVPLPIRDRHRSPLALVEVVLFLLEPRFDRVLTAKHGRLDVSSM